MVKFFWINQWHVNFVDEYSYFYFMLPWIQSGAKPAEWKFQSHLDRWLQLNTRISFNLSFSIPSDNMNMPLTKVILVSRHYIPVNNLLTAVVQIFILKKHPFGHWQTMIGHFKKYWIDFFVTNSYFRLVYHHCAKMCVRRWQPLTASCCRATVH